VRPKRRGRRRGLAAPPQLVDKLPGGHYLASVDQEHGQHGTPHRASEANFPPGPDRVDRTKKPKLELGSAAA